MISQSGPTHAVILAAGLGSRLLPITDNLPKPLVSVHGIPILHNALSHLAASGISDITIVVGYRQAAIRQSCGTMFAGARIHYVDSAVYDRTGSAYSLWLARDALLRGDVLLLEGDVFFERAVLQRLIGTPPGDVAAVSAFDGAMTGSAVVLTAEGAICDFRTGQAGSDKNSTALFKTMNLYRLMRESLQRHVVPGLERLIRAGVTRAYVEELFADLVAEGQVRMVATDCSDLKWFEIDNETDLRTAERIFRKTLVPDQGYPDTPSQRPA